MGKRELLLIVAFVIAGALVYHMSAPPPAPGERSFSTGQIVEHIRRAIRGNRASAEVVARASHSAEGVSEVQFALGNTNLTVTGEDRRDIETEFHVRSNGYDDAEAQRLATESVLKADHAGSVVMFTATNPEAGRQVGTLVVKVPRRLGVQLKGGGSQVTIAHVASVELGNARGRAEVQDVAGAVTGGHRGGQIRLTNVGSVKLTTSGSDLRLERSRGEISLNMRGGELKASDLAGSIDLETTGTDVTLENLDKTAGVVRIKANGGSIAVKVLKTDARIDARGADVEIALDRAGPVAVYTEGSSVEVTPPATGYQLDAVAADGTISLPPGTLEVTSLGEEHRAVGPINGGGPTITLRNEHGNITLRER
jgi:hypothetical protein